MSVCGATPPNDITTSRLNSQITSHRCVQRESGANTLDCGIDRAVLLLGEIFASSRVPLLETLGTWVRPKGRGVSTSGPKTRARAVAGAPGACSAAI